MRDEIIDEVRTIKEALAEECGFDMRRIFAAIKRSEARSEAEGWEHVQPPPRESHSPHPRPRLVRR